MRKTGYRNFKKKKLHLNESLPEQIKNKTINTTLNIIESKVMKGLLVNWKTTAGGLASILMGLVMMLKVVSGETELNADQLTIAVGLIGTGVAGLMARDSDKSSQDNKIRK